MLDTSILDNFVLNKWFENSDKFLFIIDKETKILQHNGAFDAYKNKFLYLKKVITYTHLSEFMENISSLSKEDSIKRFTSNFSFNQYDVEDIPTTYEIIMQRKTDGIIVIADPKPPLSHEDAKLYLSLVNDYSNNSRELIKAKNSLEKKNQELKKATQELKLFNEELENRVKLEVAKNLQKEIQLHQQTKLASMGSMIGNIAHQWRQPLGVISILASNINFSYEMGIPLSSEKVKNDMEDIVDKVQYLSENINIFRNFLKEKKELQVTILQKEIDKALKLSKVILQDNKIQLINNIDYENEIVFELVLGELVEVIINIINNSKDAFLENKIVKPWIRIELYKQNGFVVISFEDNAGGIPKEVLPHIFDNHFTTKGATTGTGIGLYMSQQIIQKSFSGKIIMENTDLGVLCSIKIPLV